MEKPRLLSESERTAQRIESKLRDLVPVSSGKLRDSIKAHVDENNNLVDISIDGESYYKYIDEGRLPGSFPPLNDIKAWAVERGIGEKKAFIIAKTIADKGIKGKNISMNVEKEEQGYEDDLAEAFADDVEASLIAAINKIFA